MALADLKRVWLLKMLGLSSSTLSESDLLTQLYSNQQTAFTEGNGSPEGVVTAIVGSRYIDRTALRGAIEWTKISGTGNTGWQVSFGDTGWRDLSTGSLINSWTSPLFLIRRINNKVFFRIYGLNGSVATSDDFLVLPSGFRIPVTTNPPSTNDYFPVLTNASVSDPERGIQIATGNMRIRLSGAATRASTNIYFSNDVLCESNWPSTLPGNTVT